MPSRGRPLQIIDPNASCAHRLGFELRRARVKEGLTLEVLSDRVGFTPQHISEVERAKACPSTSFVSTLDATLEMDGRLIELHPDAIVEHVRARQQRASTRRERSSFKTLRSPLEVEDAKRRDFIGLGLSVVLLGPDAPRASADDWDRIGLAWAHELDTAPDMSSLIPGLIADLKRLEARGGPQRVVAQLASYVAAIAVSTGDVDTACRWWRRARSAAVASGDSHLVAYVTGRQAVQGLYGAYAPERVVSIANEALRATDAPCAGRMHALAAKAQALATLGRGKDAAVVLAASERTFDRLPRDVTRDQLSALGWPEVRLHHTFSYCGMFDGSGKQARELALRLYDEATWRGPVQVKLHGAASDADAPYAVTILSNLNKTQRGNRFIRMITSRTVDACEARGADVAELRELMA